MEKMLEQKIHPLNVTLGYSILSLIMWTIYAYTSVISELETNFFLYCCISTTILFMLTPIYYNSEYKKRYEETNLVKKSAFITTISILIGLTLTTSLTLVIMYQLAEYGSSLKDVFAFSSLIGIFIIIPILTSIGLYHEKNNPNIIDKKFTKSVLAFGAGVATGAIINKHKK